MLAIDSHVCMSIFATSCLVFYVSTFADTSEDKPLTKQLLVRARASTKTPGPHLKVPLYLLPNMGLQPGMRFYSSSCSYTRSILPVSNKLTHLTASGTAHMVSISSKDTTSRTAVAVCTLYFSNPTALPLIRSNSMKKGDVLSVAGIMAAKKTSDLIPLCHPISISHVSVDLDVIGDAEEAAKSRETKDVDEATSALQVGTDQGNTDALHEPHLLPPFVDTKLPPVSKPAPNEQNVSQYCDPEPNQHGRIDITATVSCDGKTGVEMEALTAASVAAMTVYDMCKAVDKNMVIEGLRVVRKEGGKSGTWVYDQERDKGIKAEA
jgi:cyclic pyranopterin phosphate synthase